MRIRHTVTVAKPLERVQEAVERPECSLLWLAHPYEAIAALTGSDFTSGAKHEFVETSAGGEGGRRWIVTVLLNQASHGTDVSFDRGDLRVIVRQRLRARQPHRTAWSCRVEAYPARAAAHLSALRLQGAAAWRLPRRMRRLRAELERSRDPMLVAPASLGGDRAEETGEGGGSSPTQNPTQSPTKGTLRIGPGFEGGA